MKKIVVTILTIFAFGILYGQEGYIDNKKGGCKSYTKSIANRKNSWSGKCVAGYAEGNGVLKVYDNDTLLYTYSGNLKKGKFDGQGTCTWAEGHKFVGLFKNHEQEGQGTMTYPNGDKYIGQWTNGNREGQGTLTEADGSKHVGSWSNDKKNGYGVENFTSTSGNKNKYEGNYKDSEWNGEGKLYMNGKLNYAGYFEKSIPSGHGISYDENGKILHEGNWNGWAWQEPTAKRKDNNNSNNCTATMINKRIVDNFGNSPDRSAEFYNFEIIKNDRESFYLTMFRQIIDGSNRWLLIENQSKYSALNCNGFNCNSTYQHKNRSDNESTNNDPISAFRTLIKDFDFGCADLKIESIGSATSSSSSNSPSDYSINSGNENVFKVEVESHVPSIHIQALCLGNDCLCNQNYKSEIRDSNGKMVSKSDDYKYDNYIISNYDSFPLTVKVSYYDNSACTDGNYRNVELKIQNKNKSYLIWLNN